MCTTITILGAVGIGLYTCAGLHFYSILVGRTKSDALRVLLFILCLALFIVGSLIGCGALADGVSPREVMRSRPRGSNLRFEVLLSWGVTVWVYIIINWRVLNQRLRLPKDSP